ncbi:MAG: SEC-C domain-containing protein [Actinomycetota bacterium]|nr:SEC-C domain-containing protein [Actinomycetota bacterium]
MASSSARTRASAKRRPAAGSRPPRTAPGSSDAPNPRQPCPCGSGRRYKHCHGSGHSVRVARPFEGLAGEADLIALRELVSAATTPLTLSSTAYADRSLTLATVLPQLAPALVREDGRILLGLQLVASSDDVSRDIGTALQAALEADPGQPINPGPIGGAGSAGPRLQELLSNAPLDITVHADYGFWLDLDPDDEPVDASLSELMTQANAAIIPSVRMPGEEAAYWCRPDEAKAHLRWVMTSPEERLLDALAVLGAAGELDLGAGTKYAGAFRAHGLVAPVWDLPADAPAEDWWQPAQEFRARLATTLDSAPPLDEAARRFRSKILSRQVTLR